MLCGHCKVSFHHDEQLRPFTEDRIYQWFVDLAVCPQCGESNMRFYKARIVEFIPHPGDTNNRGHTVPELELTYPLFNARPPCPPEVPANLAKDYRQACKVLLLSPEASAALSRRCLQGILRDKGYTQHDLAKQIEAALNSNTLPTHISQVMDAVRQVGNFAAHATKSQHTGEIMDVEQGEAEWNLDVLEALFDFYYVQEAANQKRIIALNARLAEAGKNPMR
jgi:hypothetical protein